MDPTKPFHKIDLDIAVVSKAKRGELKTVYHPIKYYSVLGNPFPFKLLALWKPDTVRWVEIPGGDVTPHRDHGIVTSMNCYVETGDAVTKFWRPIGDAVPRAYPGSETANLYGLDQVEFVDQFKANPGDVYLLDIDKIHSVEMPKGNFRRFIQLSWYTRPFDSVLKAVTGAVH